jgi:hypothetical protein
MGIIVTILWIKTHCLTPIPADPAGLAGATRQMEQDKWNCTGT